ncbi:unnamed protein product [Adineta ricciae]|uniref:Uncharacterized protein n=1 Tax=Adineta ricciae TaxID=249248 RepID=A0A816AV46_ADIRI|nr:unnamed protein product [Adineta ricciae]
MVTWIGRLFHVNQLLLVCRITVVNDHELDVTIMRIDHSIVGGVFNEGFESVFETFYWYELACHVPEIKSNPARSEKHNNNADVLHFADKYFGLSDTATLIIADGLEFIMAQDSNTFELIVHDVFSGSLMRSHYIEELISNCFRILSNSGILVLNLVSTVQMEVLHSLIEQLQCVFKQIRCFCEDGVSSVTTGALVNFIFFASKNDQLLQFDTSNHNRASASAFGKLSSSRTSPYSDPIRSNTGFYQILQEFDGSEIWIS